jgi:hypothetical protein
MGIILCLRHSCVGCAWHDSDCVRRFNDFLNAYFNAALSHHFDRNIFDAPPPLPPPSEQSGGADCSDDAGVCGEGGAGGRRRDPDLASPAPCVAWASFKHELLAVAELNTVAQYVRDLAIALREHSMVGACDF